MVRNPKIRATFLLLPVLLLPIGSASARKGNKSRSPKAGPVEDSPAVLWHSPVDIASRNLFYGPGGKDHEPHGTYTFVKEDLDGRSPKFEVRDDEGVKWKAKLEIEARPETAATRLVWAVGYYADEDYFLPVLRVQDMPSRLQRGRNLRAPDGSFPAVRLERHLDDQKKIGTWDWHHNPFSGSRELNGLRVMMALLNNWDVKDDNNSIYVGKDPLRPEGREQIYLVGDLGATFGTTGRSWTHARGKSNLHSYRNSKFISSVKPDYVDFAAPSRPALLFLFALPRFVSRFRFRWIGKRIPRSDAQWIGRLLAQLSREQIQDAFRAAGYSPEEVEGFSDVVQRRISELKKL